MRRAEAGVIATAGERVSLRHWVPQLMGAHVTGEGLGCAMTLAGGANRRTETDAAGSQPRPFLMIEFLF
jgi:hypothetical protein